jgi:hypothetical protein
VELLDCSREGLEPKPGTFSIYCRMGARGLIPLAQAGVSSRISLCLWDSSLIISREDGVGNQLIQDRLCKEAAKPVLLA